MHNVCHWECTRRVQHQQRCICIDFYVKFIFELCLRLLILRSYVVIAHVNSLRVKLAQLYVYRQITLGGQYILVSQPKMMRIYVRVKM